MAMWSAYYDASGNESDRCQRPLVVAGLLSTVEGWLIFERGWNAVLACPDFNIPYMHFSPFKTSRENTPFEGWQADRSAALRVALLGVIAETVAASLIVYTPLTVFNEVKRRYRVEDNLGGAYSLAGSVCMGSLSEWVRIQRPGEPMRHWFEQGDEGQDAFGKLARREGFSPRFEPNPDPVTKEGFRPLEGADFLAGMYAEQLEREGAAMQDGVAALREVEGSWQSIAQQIRCMVRHQRLEGLVALCEKYPDLFPRRDALG
jgi:hypothetical protein